LWLIFSLIIVYITLKTYKKQAIYFKPIDDLFNVFKGSRISFIIRFIILWLLLVSFSFIIAGPYKLVVNKNIEKNWIDIVLTLDVSDSMNAEDLKPTRLEAAKNIINNFLNKLDKNNRVWLVIFAWQPFTSLPLTFDYDVVKQTIKNLSTKIINQNNPELAWTAIWDALLMSKNLFKDSNKNNSPSSLTWSDTKRTKIVILLTDGDANKWVDPILAAEYLKKFGIKVYTIWIGSKNWWYIKYNVWPFTQYAKIPPLKEDTLRKIAQITNGRFYRATDNESLQKIFNDISKLTKTKIKTKTTTTNEDYYLPFTLVNIILLVLFSFYRFKEI
jgi:Ca-activated chloride channel family protein